MVLRGGTGPISLAIEGMGIEHVLDILPLQGDDGTASRRLWLLPLLAQHGRRRPCHLHYFQTRILEMARKSNVVTQDHKVRHPPNGSLGLGPRSDFNTVATHTLPFSSTYLARSCLLSVFRFQALAKQQAAHRQRVLQLWSLLPAFCTNPADVSTAFGETTTLGLTGFEHAKLGIHLDLRTRRPLPLDQATRAHPRLVHVPRC